MHWVIQEGLAHEDGFAAIISYLEKMEIPYTTVKVVPFVGDIIPDINPEGQVICMGSYSMRNIAKKKGWTPGVFDIEYFDYTKVIDAWGTEVLNHDAVVGKFKEIEPIDDAFFIRPIHDSKHFAGTIYRKDDFLEWQHRVVKLGLSDAMSLDQDTIVMMSSIKPIYFEFRCWIVDGKIATSSLYKSGSKVMYENGIPPTVQEYVDRMLAIHCLDIPFVMDIALTKDGPKIIELNTLNASGFYAADTQKLANALEVLYSKENEES